MASGKQNENKENDYLSSCSVSFQDYFSNKPSPSSTERIRYNNSRARSQFIMGPTAYKLCPRPVRNTSMLSKVTTTKMSSCFICGEEFPLVDLTAHEKECLDFIKTSEDSTYYTREKSTDTSSNSSYPSAYNSNLSTHSSSSGETSEKKYSRCYICGSDVPNYLSSIHEKNCKKSWETGLLNSICTPARKSKSKGDVSSLSRSNSRDNLLKTNDSFMSTPTLTKSKSTTNIRQEIKEENKRDATRPRNLRSSNPRNMEKKSKSITNLRNAGSSNSLFPSSNSRNFKSTQDIRQTSDSTPTKKSDPQYVLCQICGKLYSKHSISIHQRTCERTYKKQKDAGTNAEYKIKSKSLADLTKPTSNRPKSATPNKSKPNTPTPTKTRPSSANPSSRLTKNSSLSKSTGNLAPTYKRQLLTVKKDIVDGVSPVNNDKHAENNAMTSSPGLKKCYLCGQLYGTRSLPIHEKQCLKKWERAQEEEKKKKKKKTTPKKDIKIMMFGRSKFDEDNNPKDENPVEEQNGLDGIEHQSLTPSKLFGVPSPLKTNNDVDEVQIDISTLNEDKPEEDKPKPPARNGPKFVACVYCSKQFGLHSIAIHEKNCREKQNIEKQTKERMTTSNEKKSKTKREKNLSKSVGDISLKDAYESQNGDDLLKLIKCNECLRKFLKSDIEKHRIHCRVSVL